jgi:hypothetical protein
MPTTIARSRVVRFSPLLVPFVCALAAVACTDDDSDDLPATDGGADATTDVAAAADAADVRVVTDAADAAPVVEAGVPVLTARVVATGIPGVGAVAQIGAYLVGGPIRDRAAFAAFTDAGLILEADRIFVASASNFGAIPANATHAEGAILSIDPRGTGTLAVPTTFATADGQASALDGGVQLYTAQSANFTNAQNNDAGVTAALTAVSHPLSISINNAFGRPWFGNATGATGVEATESITDPDGRPLAGAPSTTAGGVFAGALTPRTPPANVGALVGGVVGTALVGPSPVLDNGTTRRAVFAAVGTDGSVAQIHARAGVDGLAPAGTIQALGTVAPNDDAPVTRAGVLFNWVPTKILYVADPGRSAIVALTLGDDGTIFTVVSSRTITSPALNTPVDLAPAIMEVANGSFASNTTLAASSDLYVANRGDGTIARIHQDGVLVAVRRVEVPGHGMLGPNKINGIAVSRDAQTLWVTVTGALTGIAGSTGAVIAVPSFSQ